MNYISKNDDSAGTKHIKVVWYTKRYIIHKKKMSLIFFHNQHGFVSKIKVVVNPFIYVPPQMDGQLQSVSLLTKNMILDYYANFYSTII